MSVNGLRKTGEKYAKRYFRLTILSVAIAAVLTAIVGAAGTPGRFSVLPGWLSVPPTVAVFVQTFGLCFAIGLVGRIGIRNLEKLRGLFAEYIGDPLRDRWNRLARRTQAVLFGCCWLLVSGALAAVGVVYFGYPTLGIAAVMVCMWPLATYWLLRRRPATQPVVGDSSTGDTANSRYSFATLRQLETRTIAVLFGFLLAVALGSGLLGLGVELRGTVGLGALVWLVSTVIVYNRYASVLETRSVLTIVASGSPDGDLVELVVRNNGLDAVDLTHATVTDTKTDRYHLTQSIQLSPGSRATLGVPASFAVSPTDAERTLPLGYTLNRSQPTPVVYTQSGEAFALTRESTDEGSELTPTYSESSTALAATTHSQD